MGGHLGTEEKDQACRTDHQHDWQTVDEPADERRKEVHADDVKRDHEADHASLVSPFVHVERCDGHDRNHDALADRHGEHSDRGEAVGYELAERLGQRRLIALLGPDTVELLGEQQRVGPKLSIDHDDGDREDDDRHHEGSGELVEAEEVGGDPAGPAERNRRAKYRTDRSRPDDDADLSCPVRLLREVGGGIAGSEVGGLPGADAEHSDQQEGIDLGDDGEQGKERAECADDPRPEEAGATSVLRHVATERHRRDRPADRDHRRRKGRECVAAGDVLGDEAGCRETRRRAHAGGQHRADERLARPSADLGELDGSIGHQQGACHTLVRKPTWIRLAPRAASVSVNVGQSSAGASPLSRTLRSSRIPPCRSFSVLRSERFTKGPPARVSPVSAAAECRRNVVSRAIVT